MHNHRTRSLLVACAALAACTAAPSPLVPQLREALKPGLSLAAAETELKRHATTYSIKTAAECDELGRKSAMAPSCRPAAGRASSARSRSAPTGSAAAPT